MAYDAGADSVTVVSGAAPSTFEVVAGAAAETGGDLQVELSDGWGLIKSCRDLGIAHFILHRSRYAEAQGSLSWPASDLDAITRIYDLGGRVSITGGMTASQVRMFVQLPVEIFIAGRALYAADDPAASAEEYRGTVPALRALECAGLFVFLTSDEAASVTGQAIGLGGDRLALWSHPAEKVVALADGGRGARLPSLKRGDLVL